MSEYPKPFVIVLITLECTMLLSARSWNFVISREFCSGAFPSSYLPAAASFLNFDATLIHLAPKAGLAELRIESERVDGLIDGIRVVEAAARTTLEIEAGPLLQTLNIFRTERSSSN